MRDEHPLAQDLGFLLSRASGVFAKTASEALSPLGLRVRSYSVLAFASEEKTGVTQRRLAELMGLDPSQLVALVDELEGNGLVKRVTDPNDRRSKLVSATAKGDRVRSEGSRRIAEAQSGIMADVRPETQVELNTLLRQLVFPNG
ncbi:MarR family winged helix-turn-helix transcriptional regulator [Umezawaea sp.]|uniref:MarR family winged helix-turn-helix transcriptional regulator n=1 Tax=Umezawaea sp. TaxID=1955258 RepID=UPI002ED110C5